MLISLPLLLAKMFATNYMDTDTSSTWSWDYLYNPHTSTPLPLDLQPVQRQQYALSYNVCFLPYIICLCALFRQSRSISFTVSIRHFSTMIYTTPSSTFVPPMYTGQLQSTASGVARSSGVDPSLIVDIIYKSFKILLVAITILLGYFESKRKNAYVQTRDIESQDRYAFHAEEGQPSAYQHSLVMLFVN